MSEVPSSDVEGIDVVRMMWNVRPRSKMEASKCVVSVAASVSPIRPSLKLPVLPYLPLRCKTCVFVLNPFSHVDFDSKEEERKLKSRMSEMPSSDVEGIDVVCMMWNVRPRSEKEASECVVLVAASLSPIRPSLKLPVLPYLPLRCKTCVFILNPFSHVDFGSKEEERKLKSS